MTDRFELLDQIGKGGMGIVWKARDRQSRDIVAVKLLHEQYAGDPAFVARFEREVDVTARIDSPYVVKMLGYGVQGDRPYACMEYVPGESLRDVLRRVGPLSWTETKRVLRQVAAGLQAAHDAGIVHRDVKPSNILVAPGGIAKLVDFGIAKASDLTALTGASTTMGTAGYIAPEGESTAAADMYALGCTAYEMLTGATPFTGDSPAQVLLKHLRDEPDLGRLPPEAREVVGWLLEKDPARRLSTARRLALVIDDGATAKLGQAVRPPPLEQVVAEPGRVPVPRPVQEARLGGSREGPFEQVSSIAGRRFGSAVIDYFCIASVWSMVALTEGISNAVVATGFLVLGAWLFESQSGQSPGKLIFRLVVVQSNGDPIGVPRSLARTTFKFVSILVWPLALADFVSIVVSHGSRRLLDRATGTEVIDLRDAEDVPA